MEYAPIRRMRAFTLVELLVVIGIISVLISILLPALNQARQAAISLTCQSNLRQVMQAIHMYANENKGILPHTYGNQGDGDLNGTYWTVQIAPFLGINRGNDQGVYYHALEYGKPNALDCPVPNSEAALGRRHITYGTLYEFLHLGHYTGNGSPPADRYMRLSKIKSASTKILVRDISSEDWIYGHPYTWNEHALFGKHGKIVPVTDLSGTYQSAYATFNAAFADGHVESILEADLGPTKYHALGGNNEPASVKLHRKYYDLTLQN